MTPSAPSTPASPLPRLQIPGPYATNPAYAAAQADYRPDHVRVLHSAISALALPTDLASLGDSLGNSPLAASIYAYAPYFVAMNSLNYQFWHLDEANEMVRYSHNGAVGALAMQAGFHAAWMSAPGMGHDQEPHAALIRASACAEWLGRQVAAEGVAFMLGAIPEPDSRRAILAEVLDGKKLMAVSHYLASVVEQTGQLSWRDARVLADTFPEAYGDPYLKKAQLTLMFIAGQWNAAHPEQPCTLDVSAAADYQLPKVLRTLGLLQYSPELAKLVDEGHLIASGSAEERAIRAATIRACKTMAEQFGRSIAEVDCWLWMNRNVDRDAKFHLTVTTHY
jgi:hypothetical protein